MGISPESAPATSGTATLCAPARRPQVSALKRVFELWVLDGDFHDACPADPAGALVRTGLDVDSRTVSFLLLGRPEHPTGELVYEVASFVDGDDLERAIQGMVDRHMHQTIGLEGVFGTSG